jgi:hypothetical protein
LIRHDATVASGLKTCPKAPTPINLDEPRLSVSVTQSRRTSVRQIRMLVGGRLVANDETRGREIVVDLPRRWKADHDRGRQPVGPCIEIRPATAAAERPQSQITRMG